MELKTSLEKFIGKNAEVYSLHFPVPHEIANQFMEGNDRRVICTINDKVEIRSGLMPFKKYWYILVNQSLQKKLKIEVGDEVKLRLLKDTSAYGMEMPEELQVLFDQDEDGNRHFHNLTPGKQRNLIYIVSNVKNIESRLNKALAIVDHLKEFHGKLDFKALNLKIKEYNQRGKLNR